MSNCDETLHAKVVASVVTRVLLGPQRPAPTLGNAVHELTEQDETVGVISAGWQEAEGDFGEMVDIVQRPFVDLALYARAETVIHSSEVVREAHSARQHRLRVLQRLYRGRLAHAMRAAVDVMETDEDEDIAKLEQRHAIGQLQALDRHHLERVRASHKQYDENEAAICCPVLAEQRGQMSEALAPLSTVVITGGNVAVLISRLRLMGMGELLRDKHLVAWSTGAMALCDRVVLYHDRAPQGQRDAEIFDYGLGLASGLVVFPGAKRRLDTALTTRLGLLSRRFAPRRCVTLDNDAIVWHDDRRVVKANSVQRITRKGTLTKLRIR